jgi:hypothetical protein
MTLRWRIAAVYMMASAAMVAAQQSRDNAPPVSGTATISGTVLLAGTGKQAARRVRVTLTNLARTSPGLTTTTDDRGAFMFSGLPAGRFELRAYKAAYLTSSYGASRPERTGTPVVVKDGDVITNLSMTIARGGVISGMVRDARSRPVPGVTVRALRFGFNGVSGERTLGMPSLASQILTDDRGEYRTYGLPPGNYLVLVPAPDSARSGGPGLDDLRQLSVQDVRQAMEAAKSGAAFAAQGSAAATPAPRVNHAAVFHPGATDIGAATVITLGLGEERRGVDIAMQFVPTATITGTVTAPSGALPPTLSIRLIPGGPNTDLLAGAGLRGPTTQPRPDGTFAFGGIAPGTYTVKALMGTGRATTVPVDTPNMWAAAEITMTGRDVNVPLTLQPGMPINGRVVFEGTQPTPAELQALTFRLLPFGTGGELLSASGRVDAEGRFSFTSVPPDTFRILTMWTAPNASNIWAIKSAIASGRDAWEAPLRVEPGQPVELTVTYTDRPTSLAGVFQDRNGRAATDYYVVLFSADRTHWIPGSRRIRTTRPATDGAFSIRGIPPGEYYLAALTDLDANESNDPALLDELIKTAARVTLRDGETTKQDFRIGAPSLSRRTALIRAIVLWIADGRDVGEVLGTPGRSLVSQKRLATDERHGSASI